MEKPTTRSQVRLEAFITTAKEAKDLGDTALRDIDSALAEQERFRNLLEASGSTPDEVDTALRGPEQTVWTSPNFYT